VPSSGTFQLEPQRLLDLGLGHAEVLREVADRLVGAQAVGDGARRDRRGAQLLLAEVDARVDDDRAARSPSSPMIG
jgi:hypothetical protein